MKSLFAKIIGVITLCWIASLAIVPVAHADSTISFEPHDGAPLQDVRIPVTISSTDPINTVSLSVKIPDGMNFVSAEDGGSIMSLWVQKPAYDPATGLLSFSGIIPGGWSGSGTLVTLVMQPEASGTFTLAAKNQVVYLNDSKATPDSVISDSASFAVSSSTIAQAAPADAESPEHFLITLTQSPALDSNAWVILFNTQDKISGVAKYEVAEKAGDKVADYSQLEWHQAESPYILTDQDLKSYIYVRATDMAGNARVEVMPPHYPITPYQFFTFQIVPIIVVLMALGLCWYLWKPRSKIQS